MTVRPDDVVAPDRLDPVEVLLAQDATRLPELVPIRHGRMLVSPFTFFRGAAAVMAADLGAAPSSGVVVQLCGDAHLANFGLFASPERRLLFDANDFDETYPGPFEWDVRRLAASLVVAARDNGFEPADQVKAARAAGRRYRSAMAEFAEQGELDVWYARGDWADALDGVRASLSKRRRKHLDRQTAKARTRDSLQAYAKLAREEGGEVRLISDPPLVVPLHELLPDGERDRLLDQVGVLLRQYRQTMDASRRAVLDRFELVDMARKVVGVGSVGTRCWIVLLRGVLRHEPLLLQLKEAPPSVLAAHVPDVAGHPTYDNQGERVVAGQRLMQAASDIFLGWQRADGIDGVTRDFYVRQLRDWKMSPRLDRFSPKELRQWGEICGWTLARAHARSGPRAEIAGYLDRHPDFARELAGYAVAYADQNEADHAALAAAVESGRVEARLDV